MAQGIEQQDGEPARHGALAQPEAGGNPDPARSENRDGVIAAVVIAVFLHLLFLWATPTGFFTPAGDPVEPGTVLDFILEEYVPVEEDTEQRYVQAALDIAERRPEQTRNFSDRDQVAAQEEVVPPSPDNSPAVAGDEVDSNRIVQGNPREEPTPPAPPMQSPAQSEAPAPPMQAAPREVAQADAPQAIEAEMEPLQGLVHLPEPGSADADAQATEAQERADSLPDLARTSPFDGQGEDAVNLEQAAAVEDSPTPRPRARVERNTSFGPLRDSRLGAVQVGRMAFDSMYSQFGEYWRRVAEVIELRWRNLLFNTRAIQFNGHRVAVRFDITREGQVRNVEITHSSAGRLAETISVDAIVGEAPFFRWTPDMIVTMGDSTTVQIVFIY